MKNITIHEEKLKNLEAPFTELFSLLKHYEDFSTVPILAYESEDLKVISQHVDNSIAVLLEGLQGIGYLLGIASIDSKAVEMINQIGFFISAITNLTEALKDLQSDTDYILKESGVMNY